MKIQPIQIITTTFPILGIITRFGKIYCRAIGNKKGRTMADPAWRQFGNPFFNGSGSVNP
jgi:hypothetical protein